MKKTRIYIDTNVVSMFEDSERGIITNKFFEIIISEPENFEIMISPVLRDEIAKNKDIEIIKKIRDRLDLLPVTHLEENAEAENLAWIYVVNGVLTENHLDDLRHVAYSSFNRCDFLISWNMKHLSNTRTISRANNCNRNNNYPIITIVPPTLFKGEKND